MSLMYKRQYIPSDIKTIPKQAERRFVGVIFDVYQWPQKMFDGSVETFEMLKRWDTVVVIAIKGDKIILTYQKQPCKEWFYAYPGGRIDETDINELAGAQRELREETGMEFASWKLIGAKQPFAKIDWIVYTFLATDFLKQGQQDLDAGELIEVKEFSFAEFMDLLHVPSAESVRCDFDAIKDIKSLTELKDLPSLCQYN